MPLENGSAPEGPAVDTVCTQLLTVKHTSDTTEIDLGGDVISSSDPDFLNAVYAEGDVPTWSCSVALVFITNPFAVPMHDVFPSQSSATCIYSTEDLCLGQGSFLSTPCSQTPPFA
jgi:hypothetical protein